MGRKIKEIDYISIIPTSRDDYDNVFMLMNKINEIIKVINKILEVQNDK